MKKHLLSQFDLHHRLYNNVLAGFTNEESNQRLHSNTEINHVKYLAGHLVNTQYELAFLAGVPAQPRWNDLFAASGQSKARDNYPYPAIEEIKTEWNNLHEKIRAGLDELATEALNNKPPEPLDGVIGNSVLAGVFDNTVAGLWAFLNHHQAYHIGQIGILRRGFGKEPMRYD